MKTLHATFVDLTITELDLSGWDTSSVTYMDQLFYRCSSLRTIYVGSKWNTNNVDDIIGREFMDCTSLVGGAGTKYDASHTDKTYARVDQQGSPGYLTYKSN